MAGKWESETMHNTGKSMERRPVPGRENPIPKMAVAWLLRLKVTPNTISITSMVLALGAAGCLAWTSYTDSPRPFWIAAAILILLRLFCNLLDGMVAFASNQFSVYGDIFNEVPDRISDTLILVGAGFSSGNSIHLGYIAALAAVLAAYLRSFGNSLGVSGLFIGPMAKQQRMFLLAFTGLYLGLAPSAWQPTLPGGLGLSALASILIILGGLWTGLRRLGHIAHELRNKAARV